MLSNWIPDFSRWLENVLIPCYNDFGDDMLRIISGRYRGSRLFEVPGISTRPTTDKNKEKLFSILGPFFEGGRAADLYSGSGAIGLEFLSRGVSIVDFVEENTIALETIRKNAQQCHMDNQSELHIHRQKVLEFLRNASPDTFDYLFADPPYESDEYEKCLLVVHEKRLLKKDGVFILETDSNRSLTLEFDDFKKVRKEVSGNTALHFYMWEEKAQ